jgi:Putative small multi-drug export protein
MTGVFATEMSLLLQLLTIAGMGAVLIWGAVPAGLAMGVHPAAVAAATCAGSIATVFAVVLIGEPARAWLIRRLGPRFEAALSQVAAPSDDKGQPEGRRSPIVRVWDRYGFIGLALIAPVFPGPAGAAALALALGIPGRRVLLWTSIGIILWTAGFTLAVLLGFRGLRQITS